MPARIQCRAASGLARPLGRSAAAARRTAPAWQAAAAAPSSTAAPPASTRRYATAATAAASALRLPADYVPPTKPPTARPPEVRKSQLLRAYTSLLRSTPLMLIFQHNNLTALEWAAIRRELNLALANAAAPEAAPDLAAAIQLQVIRTSMFDQALKIVEFFDAASAGASAAPRADKTYTHDLSQAAYQAVKAAEANVPEDSAYAQLAPLLVGPLALLTFPAVSPQHLAAALSVLSPSPPAFPAPTRRKNPGYYDLPVQGGLHKLLLIGGRVEGKVFDVDGVRWVGGIEGGLDGLRAQLVAMLQSAGLGVATTLEAAGKSLWLTMESRKGMLEEGPKEDEDEARP